MRPEHAPVGEPKPCPLCEGTMILRMARKGPAAGYQFWGCGDFPVCRGTRDTQAVPDWHNTENSQRWIDNQKKAFERMEWKRIAENSRRRELRARQKHERSQKAAILRWEWEIDQEMGKLAQEMAA